MLAKLIAMEALCTKQAQNLKTLKEYYKRRVTLLIGGLAKEVTTLSDTLEAQGKEETRAREKLKQKCWTP